MAFLDPKNTKPQKVKIDLQGPDGNAYVLLGYAKTFGEALGMTKEELKALSENMRSKDYIHLVKTFGETFESVVDVVLPNNWSWERPVSDDKVSPQDVEIVISKKPSIKK